MLGCRPKNAGSHPFACMLVTRGAALSAWGDASYQDMAHPFANFNLVAILPRLKHLALQLGIHTYQSVLESTQVPYSGWVAKLQCCAQLACRSQAQRARHTQQLKLCFAACVVSTASCCSETQLQKKTQHGGRCWGSRQELTGFSSTASSAICEVSPDSSHASSMWDGQVHIKNTDPQFCPECGMPWAGQAGRCGVHLDRATLQAVESQADSARGGPEWGHPAREPCDRVHCGDPHVP